MCFNKRICVWVNLSALINSPNVALLLNVCCLSVFKMHFVGCFCCLSEMLSHFFCTEKPFFTIVSIKIALCMLGILVVLIVSWVLLHFLEKQNLLVLGLLPIGIGLKQFAVGFLVTAVLCVLAQYGEALMKSSSWVLNENITPGIVLKSVWWDIRSVLTEELVFRGALLYILIQKLGVQKSNLISALAFGVYHWFSFGVFGNLLPMIFVMLGTGLMGYAWALAFAKTKSLWLPFGLHLGWNVVFNTVFSKGPLGELLLVSQGEVALENWFWIFNFVVNLIVVPLVVVAYVKFFVKASP